MAKEKTKAKPQTSAETERTYANAIDKIRDEMAGSKDSKIQLLGEGMTALLQLHPEWEKHVLEKGRTLAGALEAVCKGATGGCSDPIQTTKSLCGYYVIKCDNPHVLALEVAVQMMGGKGETGEETTSFVSDGALPPSPEGEGSREAPKEADPFDLDSILGVL